MSDNQSMHIEDTPKNGDSAGHRQISQKNTDEKIFSQKEVLNFSYGILSNLLLLLVVGVVSVAGSLFFIGNMFTAPIKEEITEIKVQINGIETKIDNMAEQNKKFQEDAMAIIEASNN